MNLLTFTLHTAHDYEPVRQFGTLGIGSLHLEVIIFGDVRDAHH